jgi:FG-GAP repeat
MRHIRYSIALLLGLTISFFANASDQLRARLSSLPVAAQAGISAALGRDMPDYSIQSLRGYFVLNNPRQKLQAHFSPVGVEVRNEDTRLGVKLRGYGYGNDLKSVTAVIPGVSRNRVEYRRGPLAEWYVNGPIGLEQGFTIARAPGNAQGQPLTIALEFSGDLVATMDSSRASVTLTDHTSHSRLRYSGLSARDADGQELPSWMDVRGESVFLRVLDAGARYPVIVDPWLQLAELSSSDGLPGDEFGVSVAVSGDTVVVGANQFNSTTVGAAYVFVKGANGWSNMTQTAKLTASDGAAGALFGSSVACAGGNTVVVGAPHASVGSNQNQGKAYVFVEPPSGWANMTETARLTSADGAGNDVFGYAVSMSGKTIVVGAPQASADAQFQGVAYIFVKPKTGWATTSNFKAKLTASNGQFDDGFGSAVSISGTTVVAGSHGANSGKGAAYVFVKPQSGWDFAIQC